MSSVVRVVALAAAKRLPLEFLRELGLMDVSEGVAIPYRLMDGSLSPRTRIRLSPPGEKNRSIWRKGPAPIVPYGLDRLREAYDSGFVVLVEGESDCWALWQHGYPALGIPGATMANTLKPEYFNPEIKKIFIVQEPDEAGKTFVQKITEKLRSPGFGRNCDLFSVRLDAIKDPSDLHLKDPSSFNSAFQAALDSAIPTDRVEPSGWREVFHHPEDLANAQPLTYAIKGLLQNDSATLIGGLAGNSKTFLALSVTAALLDGHGHKAWDYFDVLEADARVIYLIPESTVGPFAHRLKLFGLLDFVKKDRLLVRTLSMGPTPSLSDPRILYAAKGAYVFLDSAVRFAEGDENSASDNQRGLAADIFALLGAGARSVIGIHHAPKSFGRENTITLENVLRGTGDLGAMASTVYGVRQLDTISNMVHIECVKARDFEPSEPFQLIGRPYIDETGDFFMHKKPGECGRLANEQPDHNQGGAPEESRRKRQNRISMAREFLAEDPTLTANELREKFRSEGIRISESAAKNYRQEASRRGGQ